MLEEFATRLAAVDGTVLTPLIQQVLAQPTAEVLNWGYELLQGGFGHEVSGVYGVYRFRGRALVQGETRPWSLILKASGSATSGHDPTAWNYWKREALIYQSALLATLPPGLTAPRCFGVVEPVDEEVWLWLEDIHDECGRRWPVARYGVAAHHLGQFNGAYLAGHPLPQQPWLTQSLWPDWLPMFNTYLSDLPVWRQHPYAQRVLPADLMPRMMALWAQRERFLHALAQLPCCFCHHDAFRRNLFARQDPVGQEETVAIDWAFAGLGVVGTEASKLCISSLTFLELPATQAQELDVTVFSGYLAGLQAAGWQGDRQMVRCGYTIVAALSGLEQLYRDLHGIHSGVPDAVVERIFGHAVPQILDQHTNLFRFTLALADEAQPLIDHWC
jgi:hypothetical protein